MTMGPRYSGCIATVSNGKRDTEVTSIKSSGREGPQFGSVEPDSIQMVRPAVSQVERYIYRL